ncbi:MAG: hypothetical protein LQ352_001941, partial [Teloschistes flavicans]
SSDDDNEVPSTSQNHAAADTSDAEEEEGTGGMSKKAKGESFAVGGDEAEGLKIEEI